MSRLCFLDTETTSLRPDRRAWEVGLYVRGIGYGEQDAHRWFVDATQLDLGNADPFALKIGGFYDRHPMADHYEAGDPLPDGVVSEEAMLRHVELITRGAHLVGAVPGFDAEVLASRMRAHGIAPSWHYHLIDVEALAVGYLAATGKLADPVGGGLNLLPWKSDDLSSMLGVTVSEVDRHTALGDARWARDVYDAVLTGGAAT